MGWTHNTRPGYRLKKLEVTNWGTFDSTLGQVYSLAPEGRTALLVGQNGSGKSTLVDALLTLLVQPGVRNYNVAAGAKKRERDERTYIRGACGRSSSEQDAGSVTDYLRPADKHYSVLLACFQREDTGKAFTVAQVLQITGDGEVDKTYAFSDEERGIADDFGGLSRSERIRKQLVERGFFATTKYTEYHSWIARITKMRPKAMDVFNQTVAVKDIQSLNRFIREHMLESRPWRERIESLLAHFLQLSHAHQALVKARRQIELLEPIEKASGDLRSLTSEIGLYQQQLDATDSFFRQQALSWLKPRLTSNASAVKKAQRRKEELAKEIDALDDTQRYFKNEIEKTGGERLRQLPHQLETQQALLTAKKRERGRLQSALKTLGTDSTFDNREEFEKLPRLLAKVQGELADASTRIAAERLERARELTHVRQAIEEEKAQLETLQQRAGNLPSQLADVRSGMAQQLGLPESELVFACELLTVAEDQYPWQPAIEMVLRRFALSLLVPEEHYRRVSDYVANTPITDSRGQGQRIVCVRVNHTVEQPGQEKLHADSLISKLCVQEDHPLSPWLASRLREQFDYRCCETLEQFQRAPGPAITRQRHAKLGSHQHEKDDRPHAVDSNGFVLGWDNAQRLAQMQARLSELKAQEKRFLGAIETLELQSKKLSRQMGAVDVALSVPDFDLVDTDRHQREIDALELERRAIEDSNDAVRVLRSRLDETIARRFEAQRERDTQIAAESSLLGENAQARRVRDRHQQVLQDRESDGSLTKHQEIFARLEQSLGPRFAQLSDLSEFAELQTECTQQIQSKLSGLGRQADPLRSDVVRAMQKFLSESPEERADLNADLLYIDGFLGLLDQLRREDLPRHEIRFRERLNEKVIQEIGVFHAALECEKQEILSKIETLNTSLEQLEYRAGTFMRLEPRAVADREIRDFQTLLRECLSDHFDGNDIADEARFGRIERLIRRLREEERWRDKVIDVRRWFDFTAREIDVISGQERSCYEDSSGQSGGEKAKLAFTILVAAIAYQFDIDAGRDDDDRLHFVVVDEMFSKVDDHYAEYALQLFEKFGLQLLIVAPLDAKARVTEPYVGCYLHTVKNEKTRASEVICMTASEYESVMTAGRAKNSAERLNPPSRPLAATKPR